MKVFIGHEDEMIAMTPEMEKKLLRKIDWNILPVCPLSRITTALLLTTDFVDALCCVWLELSRQNNPSICQYHGTTG